MKVNLFIVGACKSGTTYLHDYLGQQNQICASIPKEPYFFELSENQRINEKYINTYFKHYQQQRYLLDGRHRNMFFNWIPKAIFAYNKEAKIICILRDPVERAYSHWWMWYSRRIITQGFYKTVKNQIKEIKRGNLHMELNSEAYLKYAKEEAHEGRLAYADAATIVESGYYFKQIERFKKVFKEENILIIDYKLINDDDFLASELSNFLNTSIEKPNFNNKKNSGRNYVVNRKKYPIFIPKQLKKFIKNQFFKKPKLNKRAEQLLVNHYYENDSKLLYFYNLKFIENWRSQKKTNIRQT